MNRLDTICSLIKKSQTVADIGCDHGKVSEYIIKNNLCKTLIVNDISESALKNAVTRLNNISANGIDIEFVCCDGAALARRKIDCAVIAGFGGNGIIEIVKSILPSRVIAAPQNYTDIVRSMLFNLGYSVAADILVCENQKYYDILSYVYQNSCENPPDACALMYGFTYKDKNEILLTKLLRDKQKIESYKKTPKNQEKLRIIKEVLSWQR